MAVLGRIVRQEVIGMLYKLRTKGDWEAQIVIPQSLEKMPAVLVDEDGGMAVSLRSTGLDYVINTSAGRTITLPVHELWDILWVLLAYADSSKEVNAFTLSVAGGNDVLSVGDLGTKAYTNPYAPYHRKGNTAEEDNPVTGEHKSAVGSPLPLGDNREAPPTGYWWE
jgi:hypothetical protein